MTRTNRKPIQGSSSSSNSEEDEEEEKIEEEEEDGNDNMKLDGESRRKRRKSNGTSHSEAYTVENPLNREPGLKELVSSYITEKDGYDRNHGPIPYIDATTHKVTIDGLVRHPQSLSVHQLRNGFRQHGVTCALQCAGNRRHTMRTRLKEVSGIDWFDGAVMNCRWSGPLLGDVLRSVGVGVGHEDKSISSDDNRHSSSGFLHVAFASHQTPCQDDTYYGSSIPLARCLRPSAEIILALDMNDCPLTPERGFPVRVVAPGIAGARAVKWLDRITVQARESPNFYQQRDYKVLPPEAVDARAAEEWWPKVPAIQDMPVNSVVAVPGSGETVIIRSSGNSRSSRGMEGKEERSEGSEGRKEGGDKDDDDDDNDNDNDKKGKIYARGYALPAGEDGPVVRVQVSGDDALTWTDARLLSPPLPSSPDGDNRNRVENGNENGNENQISKWSWTLWEAHVRVEPGQGRKILSRATDRAGNVQPACPEWNYRGVAYNGYGRADELTVI